MLKKHPDKSNHLPNVTELVKKEAKKVHFHEQHINFICMELQKSNSA